jgi:hydrogenase maturation protein HypF
LLFAAGAPDVLVMTSANRSSEPIAYLDDDALEQLAGIADAFLVGERPIARRVDDSVARAGTFGPLILRRSRGYAPGAVTTLPTTHPILAVGADLKNTITLVVKGQAFVSQHIGDLDHYQSYRAFEKTIHDLVSMYEVRWDDMCVVHDAHPHYLSTSFASSLPSPQKIAVQHHRAHIASILAERQAWTKRVLGVSLDGTGYGDDGSIWGCEFFAGSVATGFERVCHMRSAVLAGGDAAARYPVQAAAGFLSQLAPEDLPDLGAAPFRFPARYQKAMELVRKDVRIFPTTSMGRLFDTAAALVGFTREISFEGQAAIWVEQIAARCTSTDSYPFPLTNDELDFRPLLKALIADRRRGRDPAEIARAFHSGVAQGLSDAIRVFCSRENLDAVVLSGGVFQNELLLRDLKGLLETKTLEIWTNHAVPPNDGGISLGQAALAVFAGTRDGHWRSPGRHHESAIEVSTPTIPELTELLPAEDGIDPGQHQFQLGAWQPARLRGQEILVHRYDLRHVGHGIFREAGEARGQANIPRRQGPFEIAGKRNANNRSDAASVQGVTLYHNHRPPEARTGARRGRQVLPPDLALGDYHSLRSRVRRAAAETKGS